MEAQDPLVVAKGLDEMVFRRLSAFNGGELGVFRASGEGAGPWEMHPDTEELLYVLGGSVTVEVADDDGLTATALEAGSLVVGPRGRWHRHRDADGLIELYLTPGATEHTGPEVPQDP